MLARTAGITAFTLSAAAVGAQGNSPYSRFGLGDIAPNTHIVNRGMGGVSIADANQPQDVRYSDRLRVNFSNPASYSSFFGFGQARNPKKLASGRVLLDVGTYLENKTLREPSRADKFTSSDLNISYLQIGIPLRKGWGLAIGLRPLTRVSYMVEDRRRIFNPPAQGGNNIDSVYTEYSGDGGSFLPTIGTGFAIGDLSIGANIGYLFGSREASTVRYFENDTVVYYHGLQRTNSNFGKVYFDFGAQYTIQLNKARGQFLRLGATGNLKQNLNATQRVTIGTFTLDPNTALTDTVYKSSNDRGTIVYPASYSFGVLFGGDLIKPGPEAVEKRNQRWGFWQIGADLVMNKWSQYRYFGASDAVADNMIVRVGGQIRPNLTQAYLSRITYRAGFHAGKDYISAGGNMPLWGVSAGLGVPFGNFSNLTRNQITTVNLAFEYNNRGNNQNPLKENNFRLSLGLNLSDFWFVKRRYD
ncbi:hypothetical protein [Flaviaesturariibacter amylovorans]|uniref:Membrane protein n=1 Tax=Flaviaesturariibacter amylovorans TaxID=1084520 RepID=A0ABP8HJL3_9BACT